MRVLTATSETQGVRDNDFSWTVDGEIVRFGLVCATDRANPDGGCGCGRAFSGLNSQRATTTAVVTDLDLSRADVRVALISYLQESGWMPRELTAEDLSDIEMELDALLDLADSWPTGTVIERRLDVVQPRVLVR